MIKNITSHTTMLILRVNDALKAAKRLDQYQKPTNTELLARAKARDFSKYENKGKANPMVALSHFRAACYEMMSAIDDDLLCEIIDKSSDDNYPFAESLDEQLGRIADWTDDLASDYISAMKRGC